LLRQALQIHTEKSEVVIWACKASSALTVDSIVNRSFLKCDDVPSAIEAAMTNHSTNPDLMTEANKALKNMLPTTSTTSTDSAGHCECLELLQFLGYGAIIQLQLQVSSCAHKCYLKCLTLTIAMLTRCLLLHNALHRAFKNSIARTYGTLIQSLVSWPITLIIVRFRS
jgi:hypothetical protein